MKVAVLGASGGIGQPLSLLLKTMLPMGSQLALYGITKNTLGVAVDLSHIPTDVSVKGYIGDQLPQALEGADVVVILAGVPRKPGMTRADLFAVNADVIKGLVEEVGRSCPKALVAIVTNPVNSLVPVAAATLKRMGVYDPKRLFGVTELDVSRTNTFVAEHVGRKTSDIYVPVIGGHSGPTILPLLSHVKFFDWKTEDMERLNERIKNAGTEVVEAKAGSGSATLSMAQAAAWFTLSLVRGLLGDELTECAYVASPDMDVDFFARPIRLGVDGIKEFIDFQPISAWEEKHLKELKATLRADISQGYDAVAHEA